MVNRHRGPFLISGNEIFVGRGLWIDAVRWFRSHSAEVLGFEGFGFEGFDADGRYLKVRDDYIADLKGVIGVEPLAAAALGVLIEWEAAADRPQFVTFVARPAVE
jgi:hypothetical protein